MGGGAARSAGEGWRQHLVAGLIVLLLGAAVTAVLVRWEAAGALIDLFRARGARVAVGGSTSREVLVSLDTFLVNLADPRGDRFLKATIRAVLDDSELADELQGDDLLRTRVRDRVLSALAAKTFDEISTPGGREALREQLRGEINRALPDDAVTEVLFVDFVAQ